MSLGNPFRSPTSAPRRRVSKLGDQIFLFLLLCAVAGIVTVAVGLVAALVYGSRMALETLGLSILWTRTWDPPNGVWGIVPFVIGTLVTSALALLIALPLGLGASIFLTEHAPPWLRVPIGQIIELLAAIPSIIFGFWGLIVLAPFMRTSVDPILVKYLGWTGLFGGVIVGQDYLTASLVLAVMAIPTITAVSRDSIATVPRAQKEAALSIGATDWEVTRRAVLPYARSGIIAGAVLGLGRALGETMAVLLTIGNSPYLPTSFFSQGETIAAAIANYFTETDSGPLEIPVLLEAGLILLLITLVINVGARLVLSRFQKGGGAGTE